MYHTRNWVKRGGNIQKDLQNRNRLTDIENRRIVTKGERWGRDKLEV